MKAKLIVEGMEFPIEIQDPELEKLLKPPKKTGYERVPNGTYYFDNGFDAIEGESDNFAYADDYYNMANYYSDETLAENNARADTLMRQLRRYAVEHRESILNWSNPRTCKYYIFYDHNHSCLDVIDNNAHETYNTIYFDSEKVANNAIMLYRDELIWYFTEYKDSL